MSQAEQMTAGRTRSRVPVLLGSALAAVLAAGPFLLLVLLSDATVHDGAPTNSFWLIPIAAALLVGWIAHPLTAWQRVFVALVECIAVLGVSFYLSRVAVGAAQDTAGFLTLGLLGWTPLAVPFLALMLYVGDRLRTKLT